MEATQPLIALTQEHAGQLLVAKYLYRQGARALDPQLPMSAGLAVSLFQDACELAIWAIAKGVDANLSTLSAFSGSWDAVQRARLNSRGLALPQRGRLGDLNKARVNFKHHGQLSTIADATRFAGYAEDFLRESIQLFYGQSFDHLSFADLIRDERVRDNLRTAEKHRGEQRHEDAIIAAAKALSYASDALRTVVPRVDRDVQRLGNQASREIAAPINAGLAVLARHLGHHADLLATLLLQLPVTDYFRFRAIAPGVMRSPASDRTQVALRARAAYTSEEADFCVGYATDFALKTQALTSQGNVPA